MAMGANKWVSDRHSTAGHFHIHVHGLRTKERKLWLLLLLLLFMDKTEFIRYLAIYVRDRLA